MLLILLLIIQIVDHIFQRCHVAHVKWYSDRCCSYPFFSINYNFRMFFLIINVVFLNLSLLLKFVLIYNWFNFCVLTLWSYFLYNLHIFIPCLILSSISRLKWHTFRFLRRGLNFFLKRIILNFVEISTFIFMYNLIELCLIIENTSTKTTCSNVLFEIQINHSWATSRIFE